MQVRGAESFRKSKQPAKEGRLERSLLVSSHGVAGGGICNRMRSGR